jgi:hypothetical protein
VDHRRRRFALLPARLGEQVRQLVAQHGGRRRRPGAFQPPYQRLGVARHSDGDLETEDRADVRPDVQVGPCLVQVQPEEAHRVVPPSVVTDVGGERPFEVADAQRDDALLAGTLQAVLPSTAQIDGSGDHQERGADQRCQRPYDPCVLDTVAKRPACLASVASVNVVEIRGRSEVAIGQAALGGSLRLSASGSGASSSVIASSCM